MLLIVAGDQVPVMPFGEVFNKVGAVEPVQKVGMVAKSGVSDGVTVTFSICVVPHCPGLGVKVYAPSSILLIIAGDQVPVMLFGEVA